MKRRLDSILKIHLLFDEEDEEILELVEVLPKIKRRKTHEMFLNRKSEGTFNNLIQKYLVSEEDKFVKFLRVTPRIFFLILENIRDSIESIPYNRVVEPISSEQKLCIALRYNVAIIEYTFHSIQFNFNEFSKDFWPPASHTNRSLFPFVSANLGSAK